MTITGERAGVLDFSSPYFDAKQAHDRDGAARARPARRARPASGSGSRGNHRRDLRERLRPGDHAVVVVRRTRRASGRCSAAGELDAAMLDNTVSGQFVSDNRKLKLAREFDTGEQYGMAVKKDGNIPLLRVHQRHARRPQRRRQLRQDLRQVLRLIDTLTRPGRTPAGPRRISLLRRDGEEEERREQDQVHAALERRGPARDDGEDRDDRGERSSTIWSWLEAEHERAVEPDRGDRDRRDGEADAEPSPSRSARLRLICTRLRVAAARTAAIVSGAARAARSRRRRRRREAERPPRRPRWPATRSWPARRRRPARRAAGRGWSGPPGRRRVGVRRRRPSVARGRRRGR